MLLEKRSEISLHEVKYFLQGCKVLLGQQYLSDPYVLNILIRVKNIVRKT